MTWDATGRDEKKRERDYVKRKTTWRSVQLADC